MNKMILALTMAVIVTLPVSSQAQIRARNEIPGLKYYVTHIVTDGASKLALLATVVVGAIAGQVVVENGYGPNAAMIPVLGGAATGFYIMYKMPQWTDSHLLAVNEERSTPQNIITFLSRIFIPYPLGTIAGELYVQNSSDCVS